jgi:hypothetical protein
VRNKRLLGHARLTASLGRLLLESGGCVGESHVHLLGSLDNVYSKNKVRG